MSVRIRHRLVVCESHPGHGEEVAAELVAVGYEVLCCSDEQGLLEAMIDAHPRAIIYELRHQLPVDLAVLSLVRRVLPGVPLIVVAGELAGPAVRALRAVNPTVLERAPVERGALRAAVRDAVRRARPARRPHAAVAVTGA